MKTYEYSGKYKIKPQWFWKLKIAAIIFVPPNSHVRVLKMETLKED